MKLIFKTVRVVDNEATGMGARMHRERLKKSLRAVSGSFPCSAAYLSDLELGRRNWTQDTLDRYTAALRSNKIIR